MKLFRRILGICDTGALPKAQWSFTDNTLSFSAAVLSPGTATRIEGSPLPCRVFVMRDMKGEVRAYENRCTHMGRRLDPDGGDGIACCSVSGSAFTTDGAKTKGPAKGNLTLFPVTETNTTIQIQLSGSVS